MLSPDYRGDRVVAPYNRTAGRCWHRHLHNHIQEGVLIYRSLFIRLSLLRPELIVTDNNLGIVLPGETFIIGNIVE